jgi:hypothetical protein
MESIASQLFAVIEKHIPALRSLSADEYNFKQSPVKWSKKEILGHLVDSAQNNIRRFIVAQYENKPKIVYNQDKWVALTGYEHYNLPDLIQLWWLLNKHIGQILKNMEPEMAQRESESEQPHTIEWLAVDYIKHMEHHLHQILDLEPVPYP